MRGNMRDLVLSLIDEIAVQQTKLENLREKDSITQSVDLGSRQPPRNGGSINVFQYAQINYGPILKIASEILRETMRDQGYVKLKADLQKDQVIEYQKEELTFHELIEDVCKIMFENKIKMNDFIVIMREYYFEHLMDKFDSVPELSKWMGMSPSTLYSVRNSVEKSKKRALLPQEMEEMK